MKSSLLPIKTDRPKGTINSYASVVNTAGNHRLLRHRQREIVLCLALTVGFHRDGVRAGWLYGADENRIKQCTFLYAKAILSPRRRREFSDALFDLPAALYKTVCHYFKSNGTDLYDTKKFRIYFDRLRYGQPSGGNYRVTLKHTIQYMSTPLLACMFAIFGGHVLDPEYEQIDISRLNCVKNAYDRPETIRDLQRYLDFVLKIDGLRVTENGRLIFETEAARTAFWDTVNREAGTLYEELEKGGYLDETEPRDTDSGRKEKTHPDGRG